MIGVGIIGYGYWGPNLVRNFTETQDVIVRAVSDLDGGKLALVQRRYPSIRTSSDFTTVKVWFRNLAGLR